MDELPILKWSKLQAINFLDRNKNNKVRMVLLCNMTRPTKLMDGFTEEEKNFKSGRAVEITTSTNISELY